MAKKITKPHQKSSIIKNAIAIRKTIIEVDSEKCASISFRHLDFSQGSSITEWAQNGLFEQTIEHLKSICLDPLETQKGKNYDIYNTFPKASSYTHPSFVPEDAIWARFHLTGINVIAGHIYKNIFYIVFLDNKHGFWEMDKQKK
jgi:hypothetical protein